MNVRQIMVVVSALRHALYSGATSPREMIDVKKKLEIRLDG